ncbi:hypothetical protein [Aquimarina sp. MMG016]|uniref:hypothetical protein n=1 Tax=Aquimarina sp. MMG016 TaxID=2822690 RepID=UPI001B3A213A|nr:hypothetical protein [Aquimarina sp. MMG016]MBQ4821209.1 hypothetical protein [Aquimarina sp. MMG016]
MDDFEKYIKENKHQFDEYKGDKAKLWQYIDSELQTDEVRPRKPKTIRLWRSPLLKIAASIVIIIGIFSSAGLFLTSEIGINPSNDIVNQELKDIDNYYKGLVSFQVQLVKNNTKLLPEDKEEFLSFIDELDEEYLLLKEEMGTNLNNEYILEAIVNNYKKRIELIENLLEQINDSKKSEDNEGYIL